MLPSKAITKENLYSFEVRPSKFKIISTICGIVVLVSLFTLLFLFSGAPKLSKISFAANQDAVSLGSNIAVEFKLPIQRKNLAFTITPSTQGSWSFSDTLWSGHLARQAVFTPDQNLLPDTEYIVGIKYLAGGSKDDLSFTFKTQSLPTVTETSWDNNLAVITSDSTTVNLSEANNNLAQFDFQFTPNVDIDSAQSSDKKSYIITPKTPLLQGQNYSFSVFRSLIDKDGSLETPESVYETTFSTKLPPKISDYSPKGDTVSADTKSFSLVFSEPIDPIAKDKIIITPAVSGSWNWDSTTKLVYNLGESMKNDTAYSITIPKGTTDGASGIFIDDTTVGWKTLGAPKIISVFPANNAQNVSANTQINILFDQNPDHASAEKAFHLSPQTDGLLSWSANKLIFTPKDSLSKSTTFTIRIDKGIKNSAGLSSMTSSETTFRTVDPRILLDISVHFQQKALSCEAAALKMALSFKGANVSEDDIMNIVGFDPATRNGSIWGNPNIAFVGDINGRQDTTGYGVYWDPIAKAARVWRQTKVITSASISDLTNAISNNNPVIIWGTYGKATTDSWTTSDGIAIKAWKGEHARTLIGFKGALDNPIEFYLNDPIAGRITWSKATLVSNWAAFDNSGVIVY